MNTSTILTQKEASQDEMLHVVRDYVKVRTGVDTPIHVGVAGSVRLSGGQVVSLPSPLEVQLLHQAFYSACEWFAQNRSKIPST